jgi:hypothetical protein
MDQDKENPKNESLEEILKNMPGKKSRPKLNYSRFAPIGWQRLTDEQRKELQKLIDRYLEINYSKK